MNGPPRNNNPEVTARAGFEGLRQPPAPPVVNLGAIVSTLRNAGFCPVTDANILADERTPAGRVHIIDPVAIPEQRISVVDIAVQQIQSNRPFLRWLHQHLERCAAPRADRLADRPTSGYWVIDTPGELRHTLSREGAQLLVAVDNNRNLVGLYIYHCGRPGNDGRRSPNEFSGADEKLIDTVLRSNALPFPKDTPFGVGHMVGVDRLVETAADPSHRMRQRDVMLAFHACMITELRREGIEWLVGYVRVSPAANTASRAHESVGWQPVPGGTFSNQEKMAETGLIRTVENQVLTLQVNSPLQDELIARARNLPGISFVDLDQR